LWHETGNPGPLALVGSGEYTPQMQEVEAALLRGRLPVFVQLATAAAPEGPNRLRYWHELGRQAATRLGAEQVVVPVVDRESADAEAMARLVDGAGLVYLSGGSPSYLTRTLSGTRVWGAIEAAWRGGTALAGCSAGAMALAGQVADPFSEEHPLLPGLGAVPHLRVIPHFDRFARRLPPSTRQRLSDAPPGVTVVGIDEDTALVGGIEEWEVMGRQSVWIVQDDGRAAEHRPGSRVVLPAR
jgi:cyanophycinase-like exopeptidase